MLMDTSHLGYIIHGVYLVRDLVEDDVALVNDDFFIAKQRSHLLEPEAVGVWAEKEQADAADKGDADERQVEFPADVSVMPPKSA